MIIRIFTRISTFIEDAVDNYKYKKWLKSRFDGGPTAKCFCKDCRYYSEINKKSKHEHEAGACRHNTGLRVRYC